MEKIPRRSLLRWFMSLPAVACVPKIGAAAANFVSGSEGWADRDVEGAKFPISILRLINTAERRHFYNSNRYSTLSELRQSQAMKEVLDDEAIERRGIGRTLYSQLHFDQDDVGGGWQCGLVLVGSERARYIVVLRDISEIGRGAFSSDQEGVIYVGNEARPLEADLSRCTAATVIAAARPIDTLGVPRTRLGAMLRTVAFGVPPQGGWCCGGLCLCRCCSGPCNVGCGSCTWCYCGYNCP